MELTNQPRPVTPPDALHYTLTVEQAAERYEAAGIPRTIRRIQKYCARGDLDCKKVETDFGEKYFITSESIDRHIAQISDARDAASRAGARSDAPGHPLENIDSSAKVEATPADVPPRSDALGRDYQQLYIDQLQTENAFLREQAVVLLERVKETNILTVGLQRLLSPLLRKPDDQDQTPTSGN